jgi:hypothetical protein
MSREGRPAIEGQAVRAFVERGFGIPSARFAFLFGGTSTKRRPRATPGDSGTIALRRSLGGIAVLTLSAFIGMAAVSQEWPNCLTGCTANDVELVGVTAEISGPPASDGMFEATLWASLYFNRNDTYCVRFVADVYVAGVPTIEGLVSEPFNVHSKGPYPAAYLGALSLPSGGVLSLENVKVMWSVDNKLEPASECRGCEDYGPGSKCTGDQFERIVVPLPLDAVDDADETDEDTSVTTDVLFNDFLGRVPTRVTDVTGAGHGTTRSNADGTVTYTPAPGFYGTDTYAYSIEDSEGEVDSAIVALTVLSVNDPPVAADDAAVTDENEFAVIDVTANDSDTDSGIDRTTVTITSPPANGTVDVDSTTGVVTYTPDSDTCGTDAFTYTVCDVDGAISNEAVASVDVLCNAPPLARDDFATTDENSSIGINVIANDTDTDGLIDPTTIVVARPPRGGSVSVHPASGVVTYTPDPGACGVDSFGYTVADDDGASADEATVEVDVLCDDPPLAVDDLYGVSEGETLDIADPGVLSNDVTTPHEPLVAVLMDDARHGALLLNSDGSFTYIHDGSETTSDSFTYLANDGREDSNVASVSIVVAPSNDPPFAGDDQENTDEDVPVTIDVLANDTDPDGDSLSVDWVSLPLHGKAINNGSNATYVPDPDFHGVDAFVYTVSDGSGETDEATVRVTVAPVNDPPIAQDDSAATEEGTPVTIEVIDNDSDPDGDSLIVTSIRQPKHGDVDNDGTNVTYTPDSRFNGSDTFTYTISDGHGGSAMAAVTVAVALVNEPPEAGDDDATTREDTPVTVPILANDHDPDGDDLIVESVAQPQHGTVMLTGTSAVYAPDPGFFGTDSFTYTVVDGHGGTADAMVTLTVAVENDPPIAQDDRMTASEGRELTIPILVNDSDPDGDDLLVESVTQPKNGRAINGGTDVAYIPAPGFAGTDTFTYTVSDGRGKTDTASVIVTIASLNHPPLAQDDSAATDEGTMVLLAVLANDSDPDGDFLLVDSFSQPMNGVVLNARTGVSYIPDPGFQGIDAFTYTVTDGNGGTAKATVTVSVAGVNDPPLAQDDNAVTDEGSPVAILVLLNDDDPDGDAIAVESVTSAEHGTVSNRRTEVTYAPDPGFSGVDEFEYTVSDGKGGTDKAIVFVAVAPVNDPPTAQDDSATTGRGRSIAVAVLLNDSDPDADPLSIESVTQPEHGTVAVTGGDIVFTPNEGFTGTDSFAYTVTDGRGKTDMATVTVGVSSEAGAGGATEEEACDRGVIISEIAWAGTAADPRDEWIELRNLGTTPVDLDGWELRWRRTHPSTPEDQAWKVVELSGALRPSSGRACDEGALAIEPAVRFSKRSPEDAAWFLSTGIGGTEAGFYVLERRHDDAVIDARADLVYDTSRTLALELSDLGEVVLLVDDRGEVVDTANASSLGRDGWVAGSATTFGTMERTDPLAADTAENWHTNAGIIAHGEDAKGRLLRATPGGLNSPVFEDLSAYVAIEPVTVRCGETLGVDFLLPRQDRRTTGWPWISVSRPGFAGTGGAADLAGYSFSGRYEDGDRYVLEIGTRDLPPGTYVFWVTYGRGQAALVPILVTR